jgi:RNA polymerase sigma-70 factor (ECF subfamily)
VPSFRETFARGFADADRELGPDERDHPALEAALEAIVEGARAAWRQVRLDPETFVRHLGWCVGSLPERASARAALAECHATDLFLACAAGNGVDAAVAVVSGSMLEGAAAAVRKIDGAAAHVQEVLQILRQRLCVAADGQRPKILSYLGRAPLAMWLAAAAQNAALSQLRADTAQAQLKARVAAEDAVGAIDPELRYLQAMHASAFEEAFKHALARLSTRSRFLLRLHCFMGMTLAELAGVYAVNDATISRWLAKARDELLDGTGRYMREVHGVRPEEFPSLARLLASQLHMSVARLLGEPADDPGRR